MPLGILRQWARDALSVPGFKPGCEQMASASSDPARSGSDLGGRAAVWEDCKRREKAGAELARKPSKLASLAMHRAVAQAFIAGDR